MPAAVRTRTAARVRAVVADRGDEAVAAGGLEGRERSARPFAGCQANRGSRQHGLRARVQQARCGLLAGVVRRACEDVIARRHRAAGAGERQRGERPGVRERRVLRDRLDHARRGDERLDPQPAVAEALSDGDAAVGRERRPAGEAEVAACDALRVGGRGGEQCGGGDEQQRGDRPRTQWTRSSFRGHCINCNVARTQKSRGCGEYASRTEAQSPHPPRRPLEI